MSADRDQEFMDYIHNDPTPFEVMHRPVWRAAGMKAAMDYAAEHPTEKTIRKVLRLAEQYRDRLEHLGAEPQSLETTAGWIRNNWDKEEQHEDQNRNSK
ncbi:MAG: hypothetical protein IKP37_02550 [Paludibacteraceae bacterium]|nr:hypothetical protein [Paludibacteraceae bacterium]